MAADGTKELILVAQDTSFYGLDLYGRPQLAEVVRRLSEIHRIAWIRLMYLYPMHMTDELIEAMAGSEKILPYVDIPLQHINDDVLTRMRRRVSRLETEKLLSRLREKIPNLAIRTTFITGFPGETEAQFEELLDFVKIQRFERLGAFAYCEEQGTPAAELDNPLPDTVKQERREQLLAVQQPIAFAWNEAQIGKKMRGDSRCLRAGGGKRLHRSNLCGRPRN